MQTKYIAIFLECRLLSKYPNSKTMISTLIDPLDFIVTKKLLSGLIFMQSAMTDVAPNVVSLYLLRVKKFFEIVYLIISGHLLLFVIGQLQQNCRLYAKNGSYKFTLEFRKICE